MANTVRERLLVIIDGDKIYQLDATEEFTRNSKASVSSNPISDGTNANDNITVDPKDVSFSGIISDDKVKVYTDVSINLNSFNNKITDVTEIFNENISTETAASYVAAIDEIFDSKRLISISLPDGISFKEAVLTSFSVNRTKTEGNGFKISISAQEFIRAKRGLLTLSKKQFKDKTSGTKGKGTANKSDDKCINEEKNSAIAQYGETGVPVGWFTQGIKGLIVAAKTNGDYHGSTKITECPEK